MKLISTFLYLRLKQCYRSIQEVGIPLLIIFLIVTIGITFKILTFLSATKGIEMGIFSMFIIGGIHTYRQDGSFLNSLNVNLSSLFFAEYTLLLIPVSIILFFMGKIEPALYWQAGVLPILLLPVGFFKKGTTTPRINFDKIPNQYFEIKTGLRKMFFVIVLFYLIVLGCSSFNGTLVLFTILILLLLPTFFEYFEPKEFIALEYQDGNFLKNKILRNSSAIQITLLPHYVLFFFFHTSMWYIGVACLVAIQLSIIFYIVLKYASYRPHLPKLSSNMFSVVFLATLLMPGMVIASVILIIHFWRKANKNLAYYYA